MTFLDPISLFYYIISQTGFASRTFAILFLFIAKYLICRSIFYISCRFRRDRDH